MHCSNNDQQALPGLKNSSLFLGHFLEHFESAFFPLALALDAVAQQGSFLSSWPLIVMSLAPMTRLVRLVSTRFFWIPLAQRGFQASKLLIYSLILTALASLLTPLALWLPPPYPLLMLLLLRLLHQGASAIETPFAEQLYLQRVTHETQMQPLQPSSRRLYVGSIFDGLTIFAHIIATTVLALLLRFEVEQLWPLVFCLCALSSFALLVGRRKNFMERSITKKKPMPPQQMPSTKRSFFLLELTLSYFFGYFTFFMTSSFLTYSLLLTSKENALFAIDRHGLLLALNLLCIILSFVLIRYLSQKALLRERSLYIFSLGIWVFIALYELLTRLRPLAVSFFLPSMSPWGAQLPLPRGQLALWGELFLLVFTSTILSALAPLLRERILSASHAKESATAIATASRAARTQKISGVPGVQRAPVYNLSARALAHAWGSSLAGLLPVITLLPSRLLSALKCTLLKEEYWTTWSQKSLEGLQPCLEEDLVAWSLALLLALLYGRLAGPYVDDRKERD